MPRHLSGQNRWRMCPRWLGLNRRRLFTAAAVLLVISGSALQHRVGGGSWGSDGLCLPRLWTVPAHCVTATSQVCQGTVPLSIFGFTESSDKTISLSWWIFCRWYHAIDNRMVWNSTRGLLMVVITREVTSYSTECCTTVSVWLSCRVARGRVGGVSRCPPPFDRQVVQLLGFQSDRSAALEALMFCRTSQDMRAPLATYVHVRWAVSRFLLSCTAQWGVFRLFHYRQKWQYEIWRWKVAIYSYNMELERSKNKILNFIQIQIVWCIALACVPNI